jgi:hypothetical protein
VRGASLQSAERIDRLERQPEIAGLMKTSIPRLSKATFRDGRSLHVLRNRRVEQCVRSFDNLTRSVRDHRAEDMAGFAVVAWSINGDVTTTLAIADGRQVGTMMVPEFVKTALMDHIASDH